MKLNKPDDSNPESAKTLYTLELNADSPTPSCKAAMGRIGGQRMGFDAPFFDN
jgi:hypothetical protein